MRELGPRDGCVNNANLADYVTGCERGRPRDPDNQRRHSRLPTECARGGRRWASRVWSASPRPLPTARIGAAWDPRGSVPPRSLAVILRGLGLAVLDLRAELALAPQ